MKKGQGGHQTAGPPGGHARPPPAARARVLSLKLHGPRGDVEHGRVEALAAEGRAFSVPPLLQHLMDFLQQKTDRRLTPPSAPGLPGMSSQSSRLAAVPGRSSGTLPLPTCTRAGTPVSTPAARGPPRGTRAQTACLVATANAAQAREAAQRRRPEATAQTRAADAETFSQPQPCPSPAPAVDPAGPVQRCGRKDRASPAQGPAHLGLFRALVSLTRQPNPTARSKDTAVGGRTDLQAPAAGPGHSQSQSGPRRHTGPRAPGSVGEGSHVCPAVHPSHRGDHLPRGTCVLN